MIAIIYFCYSEIIQLKATMLHKYVISLQRSFKFIVHEGNNQFNCGFAINKHKNENLGTVEIRNNI